MTAVLTVLDPGPLATVQDQGRVGHASSGVPRSGAADRAALRLGNRLLGNREDAAGIEATLGGLVVQMNAPLTVALTGAPGPAEAAGRTVAHGQPVWLEADAVLRLGAPAVGLRTYLSVRGGIAVPQMLGSRSTDLLAGIGPAPLSGGDRLPVGPPGSEPATAQAASRLPHGELSLRILLGPRDDWFTPAAVALLGSACWRVSERSDRVGIRLDGPLLERSAGVELPSEGCVRGSIQVSADGSPILLGPDCPVTGGYPVIAVVDDADCDLAGQARPGDVLRFRR
ncbi:MAG: biotin-dependent carboxyltransferase family protein [Nocardioidaceae bacterium]